MPAPKKTAAAPEKISPKKILRKQMEESIALALAPFITDVNSIFLFLPVIVKDVFWF